MGTFVGPKRRRRSLCDAAGFQNIIEAPTDDFVTLVRDYAELDPSQDLRFCNWSGIDFFGCDLRGFDFTGANLTGCRFVGALISGARFDAAQVERSALQQAKDWAEYAVAWSPLATPPSGRHLPDLAVFSDAPFAPEMVIIPAGRFLMGSAQVEKERYDNEVPRHEVTISTRFAIGRYPVTFEEYDQFCDFTGLIRSSDEGWGRGHWPVINVSWRDAVVYAAWVSGRSGQPYRLPSEAEWEYACRAGTTTHFSFGGAITQAQANYGNNVGRTTEVASYPANAWGVYDMHGNVWEWTEDVWHHEYLKAPNDGTAWMSGEEKHSKRARVVRGGSWDLRSRGCRSACRGRDAPDYSSKGLGFRLARTLS